jgi:hypothetical protein
MEKPAKRKPGRPPLGKRGNFTFRVRENVRERLIAAAESSNLSVSEEIERILERHFTAVDTVAEMFGGKENAQLLFAFAVAIQELERVIRKPWWTDKSTCEALQGAIDLILQSFKARLPEGWKPTEGAKYYPPLAELSRKFIDHFEIGNDAAAFAEAKARLAVRNAPAKAPEENLPPSTSSSRKAKRSK